MAIIWNNSKRKEMSHIIEELCEQFVGPYNICSMRWMCLTVWFILTIFEGGGHNNSLRNANYIVAQDQNLYLRGIEEINAALHQHVERTRQLRFTESGSESTARIPPLQSAYP